MRSPIPMALRSKVQVCSRLIAGIAGSNPAEGMDLRLLCCAGSGLGAEVLRGVLSGVCLIVCDLETSKMRRRGPDLGCCAKKNLYMCVNFMRFAQIARRKQK